MGREFELKYRANGTALDTIHQQYGDFTTITMETAYYDTPDGALGRKWWTLRRRYENGRSVCTVKTPCAEGGRGEWETECPDILEAIPKLCALGAPMELLALTAAGVEQVCAARFTRLAKTIEVPGCTVELALDRGSLLGGNRELPLCELEVELKAGSEEACVAFAKDLAARFGLEPEKGSKYRRALALAQKDRQETEHGQI